MAVVQIYLSKSDILTLSHIARSIIVNALPHICFFYAHFHCTHQWKLSKFKNLLKKSLKGFFHSTEVENAVRWEQTRAINHIIREACDLIITEASVTVEDPRSIFLILLHDR